MALTDAATSEDVPVESLSFEQAQAELEAIVEALEDRHTGLDEALALWERGEALHAWCRSRLDYAAERLRKLTLTDEEIAAGAIAAGSDEFVPGGAVPAEALDDPAPASTPAEVVDDAEADEPVEEAERADNAEDSVSPPLPSHKLRAAPKPRPVPVPVPKQGPPPAPRTPVPPVAPQATPADAGADADGGSVDEEPTMF